MDAQGAISTSYHQRGSPFSTTTRHLPVPVFDNSFFLKRHLDADALNSPSPPQSSHLELQSEQQGQRALQDEHLGDRKQIKDIFCAFKASPLESGRFVTATARETSHYRETLPISCSATGSPSKADSWACLSPLCKLTLLFDGTHLGYRYTKPRNLTATCKAC